jgi:hypothetical protein
LPKLEKFQWQSVYKYVKHINKQVKQADKRDPMGKNFFMPK